ncbi:hypothetical protein RDWZM_002132 [Blomia tropicalis]|uniref:Uncharacterized protein n=1 Tax=Blomia tropicalis TaxID=40697 RepID=A0A9Q0MFJ3_BLOTA|nr:hypothetical protein RDWZM_002132 [Blomia tropicalis]
MNHWTMMEFSNIKIQCRTEWGIELPFEWYKLDTCARCYHYMPHSAFKPGFKFSYQALGMLTHKSLNITLFSNDTLKLSYTFGSTGLILKWQQCCTDAIYCCANYHKKYYRLHRTLVTNEEPSTNLTNGGNELNSTFTKNSTLIESWIYRTDGSNDGMCPPTWDGWLCWDQYAKPGQVLERACPKHIYLDQMVPPCLGYVTKQCNATGHWYVNEENKEWSNYTMCARDDIYVRRVQFSLVTNLISMIALIPALVIFTHYKQLSSMSRIRLHKHLFTSLLFHAIISALLKWHLLTTLNKPLDSIEQQSELQTNSFPQQANDSSQQTTNIKMPSMCLVLSVLLRYFPYCLPFMTTTSYIFARYMSLNSNLESMEQSIDEQRSASSSSLDFDAQFMYTLDQWSINGHQTSMVDEHNRSISNDDIENVLMPAMKTVSNLWHDPQMEDAINQMIHLSGALRTGHDWPSNDLRRRRMANDNDIGNIHRYKSSNISIDNGSMIDDGQRQQQPPPPQPSYDDDPGTNVLENYDSFEDANPLIEKDHCWMMPSYESWHEWIINLPNLAILIINCFFLIWLLRVLYKKASATSTNRVPSSNHQSAMVNTTSPNAPNLHQNGYSRQNSVRNGNGQLDHPQPHHHLRNIHNPHHHHHHSHQSSVFSRQSILVSLRAAVLLLPLYGLHYLFIVYRPKIDNCWLSEAYHYLALSLDGFQGLAISIIFCFANSEIRHLLTRSLQRVGTRQRSTTIYMTEVGPTNRE